MSREIEVEREQWANVRAGREEDAPGGTEPGSDALLAAVRRRWRAVEKGAARGPADGFAPAAQVARAVGALLLDAATAGAGGPGAAAAAGASAGVEDAVEQALARLVREALPPAWAGAHGGDEVGTAAHSSARRRADFGIGASSLPAAGWWPCEELYTPPPHPAEWPLVPEAPTGRGHAARGAPASTEAGLHAAARWTMARELVPVSRRLPGGPR